MSPSQISKRLFAIASKIDRSKSPSRSLVIASLRSVLASLPADTLEPSDIEELQEVMRQLSNIVMSKSASEDEILQAMEKLQSVRNAMKRHRMRRQMDPKAQYVPLKSIHDKPLTRKSSSGVLDIRITADFFGMLCKKYKTTMKHVIDPSEDVQLAAVSADPWSILKFNPCERALIVAVSKVGSLIEHIKNPSEEVQLAAVGHDGYAVKHIDNPSEEVKLTAVSTLPNSIQYIDNPSEEVQLAAVRKNPYVIRHIENPCEEAKDIAMVAGVHNQ